MNVPNSVKKVIDTESLVALYEWLPQHNFLVMYRKELKRFQEDSDEYEKGLCLLAQSLLLYVYIEYLEVGEISEIEQIAYM